MRSTIVFFLFFPLISIAQFGNNAEIRTITTSVPFLNIPTNAYQKSRADIGVVSDEAHVESAYYSNAALLATGQKYVQVSATLLPWLRTLISGMNLYDGFCSIGLNSKMAIGFQYQGFSFPITYYLSKKTFLINDNRFQINYAQRFGEHLSLGVAFKHVRSSLSPSAQATGFASDFGLNYENKVAIDNQTKIRYSFGTGLNNIGNKIRYTSSSRSDFIPTNLQAGASMGLYFIEGRSTIHVDFSYQFTKMMVPSRPIYFHTVSGSDSLDANGNRVISKGLDPNVSVLKGAIQSFYDAPGGFIEEFNEYTQQFAFSQGYRLEDKFALSFRQGLHYAAWQKGGRQFISVGFGLQVSRLRFEYAFLNPININLDPNSQGSVLDNTHTFTLTCLFKSKNKV